jgi:hypothetical protein
MIVVMLMEMMLMLVTSELNFYTIAQRTHTNRSENILY